MTNPEKLIDNFSAEHQQKVSKRLHEGSWSYSHSLCERLHLELNCMEIDVEYRQIGKPLDPTRTPVIMSSVERQKASCYSFQDFLMPFWMKNKEMERKMASLLVNLFLYDPPPFRLFLFLSTCSLGALFRQRGSDRTLCGDSVAAQSDTGQKSWRLCHGAWIKHGPGFSGGLCPSQHSEEQTVFFPPHSALFSCQLVENSFFLVHLAPAAPG